MNKKEVQKIAILAVLMALGVVLKYYSIGSGEFRISFWDIPLFLAGVIAGPWYGLVCAFGADLIYSVLSPYPYSFLMMCTTLIWGLMGGIFYKKQIKLVWLFITILMTALTATLINSVYLTLYYGFESMLAMLPLRVIVLFIKWPITSTLIYLIAKKIKEAKIKL